MTKELDYGWISAVFLLVFLSFLPFLLPMADAIPQTPRAVGHVMPARKHDRVVLMIIDGLGYRKAVKSGLMPHLEARIPSSAFGMALASFPTITPSGLRAILSGHRMASEPQLPTGFLTSGELDSVMARATAAGLKAFVIGQFTWPPLFPDGHGADFTQVPYHGVSVRYDHGSKELAVDYDDLILEQAAPIISGKKGPWDFLALHLFESDSIGHALGTEESVYSDHLRSIDEKIERLSRELQEQRPTTFLLLADHGQAPDGSHGGLSSIEREVPFMIWGADARPGDLGVFPLYNAAPTLCALLGVAPPILSEGVPMLAGLQTTPQQKAQILIDLARQRSSRWQEVRAALPRVFGQSDAMADIERDFRSRRYAAAADGAENLVQSLDRAMGMPEEWVWRLIVALVVATVAACFGLAWSQTKGAAGTGTALLAVGCLLLLVFPFLRPSLWAWTSALLLGACVGMAVLTLMSGFSGRSGLDRYGWCLWSILMAAIAFQEIVDISLWSWLAVLGLFLGRAFRLTKENAASTAVSALTVLVCAVAVSGAPSFDVSLARSLLPSFRLAAMARLDWTLTSELLLLALAAAAYAFFVRSNPNPRRWLYYMYALGPLAVSSALMLLDPERAGWSWAACGASLAVFMATRPPRDLQGIWLSALCLAYYRTLADEKSWCLLALAVIVGGCLAWRSRDADPLWEGIGLLALGLWSYKLSGGQLSFSRITVAEGYRVLGASWHPYALFAVLALKPLAAFGAPILPRLAMRPLYSVLGILPLIGSMSAGSLSMFWWSRFRSGSNLKFSDDAAYAQTIFVILLAWAILGAWTAIRAADALSAHMGRD